MDNATLVLLGIYHGQANPDRLSIDDIDVLIQMEAEFDDRHGDTDWEEADEDWADTVAQWYNDTKPLGWDAVEMTDDGDTKKDPDAAIKKKMGEYTSFDSPHEYTKALASLRKAFKNKKKHGDFVDHVKDMVMWEKVELEFTVYEFCELIGVSKNGKLVKH